VWHEQNRVSQVGLENQFSCLSLLSAGIIAVYYHSGLSEYIFIF
jgi:hypothetical protein